MEKLGNKLYKVIEIIGSSDVSWEDATKSAIAKASESLDDLRVAEVSKMDVNIDNGKIIEYRVKLKVSFKYKP
jgi:flavin-binding protein dodecin